MHVLGTAEVYHALRKVCNFYRFAHVEDKDLATIALHTCLKHQLASLGNEHEKAYDVGIGHGYGATGLYLLLKQRNDRTVGTKHVAETCCYKLRLAFHLTTYDGFVKALHIDLADALRATHHVGWVHSLVGSWR